jgi:hypothetical protein
MSSIYQNDVQYGPSSLISSGKNGPVSITENGPMEWMNIEFAFVDSVRKVVLNDWTYTSIGDRIVGSKIVVTVAGVITFNHTITRANFDSRNGLALTFASASVRITNSRDQYLVLRSILVYDADGKNISASGTPTMSSVLSDNVKDVGPWRLITGRTFGGEQFC